MTTLVKTSEHKFMKKLIPIILTIACVSISIYGQSISERPVTAQPTREANLISPRPKPPSCCIPFRTADDGSPVIIMKNASTEPTGSGELPTLTAAELKDRAEKYREALEAYRKTAETLRKDKTITKIEYSDMIKSYKVNVADYKIELMLIKQKNKVEPEN